MNNKSKGAFDIEITKTGKKFAELREKKGFKSVESFTREHKITRMNYWVLEKGKGNPTIKTLVQLLSIHGLTLKDLFQDNNERQQNESILS